MENLDRSQLSYLYGLLIGHGHIYPSSNLIAIEFSHKNRFVWGIANCEHCGDFATKPRGKETLFCKGCGKETPNASRNNYDQVESTTKSIDKVIGPFLTSEAMVSFRRVGTDTYSMLILDFSEIPDLLRQIYDSLGSRKHSFQFELPDWVFEAQPEELVEFFSGILDTAGYPNAGNWFPSNGIHKHGRMRCYLQFPRSWKVVAQLEALMHTKLGVAIQTVDWGHPNIRDGNTSEFVAGRIHAWAREQQVKFFPESFPNARFRIEHKQNIYAELLAHNVEAGFKKPDDWFPPRVLSTNSVKPIHPMENSDRLPSVLRRHFDAFWQINLSLSDIRLNDSELAEGDIGTYISTGETRVELRDDLIRRLRDASESKSANVRRSIQKAQSTNLSQSVRESLEKDTYPILAKIFESELSQSGRRNVLVIDNSAGHLSKTVARIGDEVVGSLEFCEAFDIRPDVVGFSDSAKEIEVFVESKIVPLDLKALGQLVGYCAVAMPLRAVLVSTIAHPARFMRILLAHPKLLEFAPGRKIEVAQLIGSKIFYLESD